MITLGFLFLQADIAWSQPQHAIAMHGSAKYPSDFTHFEYVNPNAPKGGEIKLASPGTFDSFNPYI
ncbi:MAG: ABC transporter substrate-binding protein, partial [Betaproteobacteria bacterium]